MFLHSIISSWAKSLATLPVLGLDFSDLSIKFIRFDEPGASISVHCIGNVGLPAGVMVNGAVEKPAELVTALRNLKSLDGRLVKERFVVASLPEEKGFIQLLRIPRLKTDNLDAAVRWELESVVPLPAEEIYFDYEVLTTAGHSDHVDVLLLAYPRALVDSYVSVLSQAGYIPMALELESQAIVRALVLRTNAEPMLVIDLGTTRTSFVLVTREKRAKFRRSLNSYSKLITKILISCSNNFVRCEFHFCEKPFLFSIEETAELDVKLGLLLGLD